MATNEQRQKLQEYLLAQQERRAKMETPEFRQMEDDRAMRSADSSGRRNLAALLMKSAGQMGTVAGKTADASPVAEYAQGADRADSQYRGMIDQQEQEREKRYGMDARVYQYLADKEQKQADDQATAKYRSDTLAASQSSDAAKLAREEKQDKYNRDMDAQKLALEREKIAASKDAKLATTPAQAKTDQETTYRYNTLQNNAEKLKQIVAQNGTMEVTGSAGTEMDRLIYEMAIDYAKLVDPDSVAREGEVDAAKKFMLPFRESFMGLGPKGLGTNNATAGAQIDNYVKALDDRLAMRNMAKGGDTFQADKTAPVGGSGTALAAPPSDTKMVNGKKYQKVQGGWQEVP